MDSKCILTSEAILGLGLYGMVYLHIQGLNMFDWILDCIYLFIKPQKFLIHSKLITGCGSMSIMNPFMSIHLVIG